MSNDEIVMTNRDLLVALAEDVHEVACCFHFYDEAVKDGEDAVRGDFLEIAAEVNTILKPVARGARGVERELLMGLR